MGWRSTKTEWRLITVTCCSIVSQIFSASHVLQGHSLAQERLLPTLGHLQIWQVGKGSSANLGRANRISMLIKSGSEDL